MPNPEPEDWLVELDALVKSERPALPLHRPQKKGLTPYQTWMLVQTIVEVFTPLDRLYQRVGDTVFHLCRTSFFASFGTVEDDLLCFLPSLIMNIVLFIFAAVFQFFNLHQALIRSAMKKLVGDPTPPHILWRHCLFTSVRDRPFE